MFNIGDKVYINPESAYYNKGPSNPDSSVIGIIEKIEIVWIYVRWNSNHLNGYHDWDLCLFKELNTIYPDD